MLPRGILMGVLLVAAIAGAGCFGDDPAPVTTYKASATNAKFARGFAYDGTGLMSGNGSATIDVDAASNTGIVAGTFESPGATFAFPPGFPGGAGTAPISFSFPSESWGFEMSSFAGDPAKVFQAGGVALDFDEHGDSGVGDTSIPKVRLLAAGWGDASVTRNGANYPDPLTGKPSWVAHFMVMDKGARAADGQVKNKDGSVYDPASPAAGEAKGAGKQVWVVLKTNPGDRILRDFEENVTATNLNSATYESSTMEVPVELSGAVLSLDFTLGSEAPAPTPPLSELTWTVYDPDGAEVHRVTLDRETPTDSFQIGAVEGTYTMKVAGRAAAGNYLIHEKVTYPDQVTLLFEYDTVTVG